MATNGNGQFEYPQTGWSTGGMRKVAKAPPGAMEGIGRSWQELMGAKKRKETKASELEPADTPKLGPNEEMHKDFSSLPDDWAHIERTENGLKVLRGYT